MKICMITDTYHPVFDGIVRYLDYLIPELIAMGHEVTVVCPHIKGEPRISQKEDGLKIVRTLTSPIKTNAYQWAIPDWRLVKAVKQSDIVVLHSLMPLGIAGGYLAKFLRKKIGFFCHHDERVIFNDIIKLNKFVRNILYKRMTSFYRRVVDVFFHATERFKRKLLFFDAQPEKINHTPFAINKKTFHPTPEFNLRERYNIPEDAIITCYLGRLSVEKNVDNILKAIDLSMEENPKIYGLIVGDGPDKEKFLNLPLKNPERFVYTGFIPENELQSHYAASDIFVTPTLNESSCFTVFEAMTCKVPIITAEYDHDPDIVHENNAMLVNDVLDFEEIAEYITALASDKDFRFTVAENGYSLISNRTWENHAKKFMIKIEEIFDAKKVEETKQKTMQRSRRFWKRFKDVSSS
ncbi:MAG: glycosyltransferase family 4 protein [Candidatus Heimdallarchaeota archaeon]